MSRVLPLAVTSSASKGAYGSSPASYSHFNGHADSTTSSSSKHSSRRLQPIGADAARSSDKTLNGIKRSSLVLEPGSKDTAKQGVARQASQEGKKSSTSSVPSSADQSSKDASTVAGTTQNKLLPRLV